MSDFSQLQLHQRVHVVRRVQRGREVGHPDLAAGAIEYAEASLARLQRASGFTALLHQPELYWGGLCLFVLAIWRVGFEPFIVGAGAVYLLLAWPLSKARRMEEKQRLERALSENQRLLNK
jgi:hypothetical protein